MSIPTKHFLDLCKHLKKQMFSVKLDGGKGENQKGDYLNGTAA
jgi:hypothetical protein